MNAIYISDADKHMNKRIINREYTIIVPFAIEKKNGKRFSSCKELIKELMIYLNGRDNRVTDNDKSDEEQAWIEITDSNFDRLFSVTGEDNTDKDKKADDNLQNEEEYFYRSAFDVIYSTDRDYSCNILRNPKNQRFKNEKKYKKIYIHAAVIGVGMLVLECSADSDGTRIDFDFDKDFPIIVKGKTDKKNKNTVNTNDLNPDTSNVSISALFPKPFIAQMCQSDEESETDYENFVLSRNVKREIKLEDILDFFGHDMMLYNFCIIQKAVLVHVVNITSRHGIMKGLGGKKSIEKLLKIYIEFLNRYDLIETTHDKRGRDLYKTIREEMGIPDEINRLEKNMNAQVEYHAAKRERILNILVFILAIVDVIFGALQVWGN